MTRKGNAFDEEEEHFAEDDEYEYEDDDADDYEYEYEYEYEDTGGSDEENAPPNGPGVVRKNSPGCADDSAPGKQQRCVYEQKAAHTAVGVESLIPITHERISEVVEALGISREAAAILLGRNKWNPQRVLQAYLEGGDDTDKTLRKAGIYHRCCNCCHHSNENISKDRVGSANVTSASVTQSKRFSLRGISGLKNDKNAINLAPFKNPPASNECLICMEDVDDFSKLTMPCGHSFCMECWHDYLENAIVHEGATCFQGLKCPHAGCGEAVTEIEISEAAPELLERYYKFRLSHFVESCGLWCPTPGCERAVIVDAKRRNQAIEGGCRHCGATFCLGCGHEVHAPLSCKVLNMWLEKEHNESETANWMTCNTKNCPKCDARIYKDGGCMSVRCSQCKHSFCWGCGGTSCGHVTTCNKYLESDETMGKKRRAKSDLERYMHYYDRYKNHGDSQKFARDQGEKQMHQNNTADTKSNADDEIPEFLIKANRQLLVCRRVLKYTYVVAFYKFMGLSEKPNASKLIAQKERFEFHQGILEMLTESLSKASEKDAKEMNRLEVINRTGAIGKFISSLLEHVSEGIMENDEEERYLHATPVQKCAGVDA